jgi:hypothetical protein
VWAMSQKRFSYWRLFCFAGIFKITITRTTTCIGCDG